MGVEPTFAAWEASVIPIYYARTPFLNTVRVLLYHIFIKLQAKKRPNFRPRM